MKLGGRTRLFASAAKRSKMMPIARILQRASGYMKNPPLRKSWKTETSGGGVACVVGAFCAAAVAAVIESAMSAMARHRRRRAFNLMGNTSLCRQGPEPRPGQFGLGGVLVLGRQLLVLLLGLIGLLEFFESATGFDQGAGRPYGIGVNVFDGEQGGNGLAELRFGQEGFADLKLGAGGGFAVAVGDDLLVRGPGLIVLLLIFERPPDAELGAGGERVLRELIQGRRISLTPLLRLS